jgi:uncharacterized protein YbaR (Trm112 family)
MTVQTNEREIDKLQCPHCRTFLMVIEKEGKSYLTYESLTHFIACSDTAKAEQFRDAVKAGEYAKDGTPLDEPETP